MALELVLWCFVLVLCWCFLLCWSVLVLCAGVVGALCFAELQLADVTADAAAADAVGTHRFCSGLRLRYCKPIGLRCFRAMGLSSALQLLIQW